MVDPVESLNPLPPPLWLLLLIGKDAEGKFLVGHHVVVGTAHRGTVLGHFEAFTRLLAHYTREREGLRARWGG